MQGRGSSPALLVLAALLLMAAGILLVLRHPFSLIGPYIAQTTSPVALCEAKENCPIPLPESARNVRYAVYREWQAHEVFVRFEAPTEDCIEHAKIVMGKHDQQIPDGGARPIDKSPQPPAASPPLDVRWFDIDQISEGVAIGEGGPHQPRIWIDLKRGVFYYHISD